jgi:hypothetical protein
MRALAVMEDQTTTKQGTCLANATVSTKIDFFILDRTPQSFRNKRYRASAAAVHADGDAPRQQQARELGAGELAPLIGVENLRPTVPVSLVT